VEVLQIRDVLEAGRDLRRANPNSLLTFIGNTPLIKIRQATRHLKRVQIFAKTERLSAEHPKLKPSPPPKGLAVRPRAISLWMGENGYENHRLFSHYWNPFFLYPRVSHG